MNNAIKLSILITIIALNMLTFSGVLHKKTRRVDKDLETLVKSFVAEYNKRVDDKKIDTDIIVQFSDDLSRFGASVIGLCHRSYNSSPEVYILRSYFNDHEASLKEELVFHELGHCLLGRPHKNDVDSDGIPLSLMYPYILGEETYNTNSREYYLSELFTEINLTSVVKCKIDIKKVNK
jgi:hypothetical protein